MDNLGISIIIPFYDCGNYLKESVESVLKQKIECEYEIILVNDGCKDLQTLSIFKSYKKNKKIVLIDLKNNKGAQYARNIGVRHAKYPFIMVLDSDDMLNNSSDIFKQGTYFDRALNLLNVDDAVAFVHSTCYMFDDYFGYTISSYPLTEKLVVNKHHVPIFIIYRKKDYVTYNENIFKWNDWSFGVSILNNRYKNGYKNKICWFSEPYYLYRIHNNPNRISKKNVSEKEMVLTTVLNNKEIFLKYFPNQPIENIVDIVCSSKPNRLQELLFVAENDLELALKIAKDRGYDVFSESVPSSVP